LQRASKVFSLFSPSKARSDFSAQKKKTKTKKKKRGSGGKTAKERKEHTLSQEPLCGPFLSAPHARKRHAPFEAAARGKAAAAEAALGVEKRLFSFEREPSTTSQST
jgi:hypothetical protein